MLTRRQIRVGFEMFRAQRTSNCVFLGEPFTQVDEPAAPRAKWAEPSSKPVAAPLTRWALDYDRTTHGQVGLEILPAYFRAHGFEVGGDA